MALIPKYHTTVAMFPVDPADVALINAGSSDLTYGVYAGQAVGLTSGGYVKHATNTSGILPIGLAGDSLAVSSAHTAYQDSILISAGGTKKTSQNRVSDYFNETLGSGLISVYTGTGQFWTDMYVSSASFTVGGKVYSAGVATYITTNAGFLTNDSSSSANLIGICTSGPVQYPSGVPGVDGGSSSDYSLGLASYNGTGFVGILMQL